MFISLFKEEKFPLPPLLNAHFAYRKNLYNSLSENTSFLKAIEISFKDILSESGINLYKIIENGKDFHRKEKSRFTILHDITHSLISETLTCLTTTVIRIVFFIPKFLYQTYNIYHNKTNNHLNSCYKIDLEENTFTYKCPISLFYFKCLINKINIPIYDPQTSGIKRFLCATATLVIYATLPIFEFLSSLCYANEALREGYILITGSGSAEKLLGNLEASIGVLALTILRIPMVILNIIPFAILKFSHAAGKQ